MRKTFGIVLVCLLAALAAAQQPVDKREPPTKSVSGQVMDGSGAPLPDAVVYLKNTRTLAVKSFIAGSGGEYSFHGLSPNVDYEVFAQFRDRRSDTKTVSSFDTRSKVVVNLKIDVGR